MVVAGLVARPHGLDGSFYVAEAKPALLEFGASVTVGGSARVIVRRAGTQERPIVRVSGCEDRDAAEALRGEQLVAESATRPPLGPDEWWAEQLEGARVFDGEREVGVVRRLLALPSCECLEVERAQGRPDLLVPLVRDAIRSVDVAAARIEVDMAFLGEAP
jgi:16S rRNA processing protein RimM